MYSYLDPVPALLVLVLSIVAFGLASELGFRLARVREDRKEMGEDTKSYAGVLVTALLALLGLLLAFSFSIVESRFMTRKKLVLDEANAIGTTYLRADMLPDPHGRRIQEDLRRYVDVRLDARPDTLRQALRESEEIHSTLWTEADEVAEAHPESEVVGRFIESLNEVLDLHQSRVTVGLHNRLPFPILLTLYVVTTLAMIVLGYSAGLAGTRAPWMTLAVITAISVVLMLIIELDRPWQRVFQVSQDALDDVRETMSKSY